MAAFADAIYAWRDISVAAVGAEKAIFKNVSGYAATTPIALTPPLISDPPSDS